jgi:glycyl-tRNA synthetase beta chain
LATFLLEIGTEELPADFARLALPQLEHLVRSDLAEQRLSHGAVTCTSTPRRLSVLVADLAAGQQDLEEERKGPPAGQAFKDGVPSQAAIGFAKRCGIEATALEVRETAKGAFVFARVREAGRPSAEVLAQQIPLWIQALQGRRFMRWGEGDNRFSRPVRWLVALLDANLIPITLKGSDPEVVAGQQSRGHRLWAESVTIPSADRYVETLAAVGVEVNRASRRAAIEQAVQQAAAALGARPDLPEELLEELTDLVEAPQLFEGSVAEHYLSLPAELLATARSA